MSLQAIPVSQRLTYDVLWHLFGHVSPMAASQVSQHWRLVALNSPSIWSNITIRLYTSSQQHLLALAYFRRSRNIPITLTIHATRSFKPWEKVVLLLPYAYRFRCLHVNASAGSLVNLLWMELDVPMPRLEAFETVITKTSRFGVNRKVVTIGENTNIIPPICHHYMVDWDSWNTTGLTALILDTTRLWNKPDLDAIYYALANTCHTLQHFEYQGFAPNINNEVDIRLPLEFPALRSLTIICHDDIVPLLQFMSISALDSLTLRDFIVCPTSTASTDPHPIDLEDPSFNPDGLLQVIKQWTSITHLEIFGIGDLPSDDLPPPQLLDYIKSLNQLSSLVLYGIGAATSIAYTLFMYDPIETPLLPKLSCFLLAISDTSPIDDLCNYLIARQHHKLPRLQKLTINLAYWRHLSKLDRYHLLGDGCDNFFVLTEGPVVAKYNPIKEITLQELLGS